MSTSRHSIRRNQQGFAVSDIIGQGVTSVLDVTPVQRGCYVPGNAAANATGGGFTLFSKGGNGDDGDGVFRALCSASESRSSWAHMPARAMRTPPRRTWVGRGPPAAPGAHRRARPIGFADCQRTGTTRRGVTASPRRFDTRAHQISIDRRHFGKPRACSRGGSAAKRAARPPQASRPHPRRTILRFEK